MAAPAPLQVQAYKGVMRVTVHVKGDYERATRVVVNPATDSWKSFIKDIMSGLRIRTDDFVLMRASSKAAINGFADIRQNDIITLDPKPEVIDNSPLTDSPLSVARTKHLKYESIGPTSQFGTTFVVLCTKNGLEDAHASYGLRLELEVPFMPKHPYMKEYDILSVLEPHPNVSRIWSKFSEPAIHDKFMQKLPEFILTSFDDKLQINKDWRPKANYTLVDIHRENLGRLRPLFRSPLPFTTFIGWACDIAAGLLHLQQNRIAHCNISLEKVLIAIDGRAVISDLTHAKRFKKRTMCMTYEVGVSAGGDVKLLSPEVLNGFYFAHMLGRGEVQYAKQPSWELGNMLFELATGAEAWPHYPDYYYHEGVVVTAPASLRAWLPTTEDYPPELLDAIMGLMDHRPEWRPEVKDILTLLRRLQSETEGADGTHRFPTDASPTGTWVQGRSVDGTFAQVPYDNSLSVTALRDHSSARLALGRWWEYYSIVYEGKEWPLWCATRDLHLRPQSVLFLMSDDNTKWPEGPLKDLGWTWESIEDEVLLFRMLGQQLEDQVSDEAFVLQGLTCAIDRLAVPEDEWDGPAMLELKNTNKLPALWRLVGRSLCPFTGSQFVSAFAKHPGVVAKVAELLHWFALHESVREKIRRTYGVHMLITGLAAHRFYAPVQLHVAWAIGNFALDEFNRDFIRELEGVHGLVEAMEAQAVHPDVVRFCLTALALLSCQNVKNQNLIRQIGGLQLTLKLAVQHADVARVQDSVCQVVFNIAHDHVLHREWLPSRGIIPIIIKAMKKHYKFAPIFVSGSMALMTLAYDHPSNKRAIGDANAITYLSEALSTHLAHPSAMRYVVNCLTNLCNYDEKNFREALSKGVIEDAILVRATHTDFLVIKAVNRLLKLLHGTPALELSDDES